MSPSLAAGSGKGARHCCYCPPSLPRSFPLADRELSLAVVSAWPNLLPSLLSYDWLTQPSTALQVMNAYTSSTSDQNNLPLSFSLSSRSLPMLPSLIIITTHHNLHLYHLSLYSLSLCSLLLAMLHSVVVCLCVHLPLFM